MIKLLTGSKTAHANFIRVYPGSPPDSASFSQKHRIWTTAKMFYLIRPKLGISPWFRFACGESESPRDVYLVRNRSSGVIGCYATRSNRSYNNVFWNRFRLTPRKSPILITNRVSYAYLYGESDKDDMPTMCAMASSTLPISYFFNFRWRCGRGCVWILENNRYCRLCEMAW
jgi:hypothetical protein